VGLLRPGRVDSLVRTSSRRDGALSGDEATGGSKTCCFRVLKERAQKSSIKSESERK